MVAEVRVAMDVMRRASPRRAFLEPDLHGCARRQILGEFRHALGEVFLTLPQPAFFSGRLGRALTWEKPSSRNIRLMALAAVVDNERRAEAAAIGLRDRQTLRDWVLRFNAEGAEGLLDRTSPAHRRS